MDASHHVMIPGPDQPPTAADIYRRGIEEVSEGEFDAALATFNRYLSEAASTPTDRQFRIAAKYCIAGALDAKDDARRAIAAYEEALAEFDALAEADLTPWIAECTAGVRVRYAWLRVQPRRRGQDRTLMAGLYGAFSLLTRAVRRLARIRLGRH